MATNFYSSSSSNPVDHFGLGNELNNGQLIPSFHSNPNMNHVNENGLINSQLLLYSHSSPQFYPDDLLSQRSSPSRSILGQVGLNQRVTEVRRTYVSSHRVQIHSIIDYTPMPNHSTLSPNEVLISQEVMKTARFLVATSTKDRIFAPNYDALNQGLVPNNHDHALGEVANNINIAHLEGLIANDIVSINQSQPSFRNQNLFSPNQVNYPFPEIKPFHNPILQKRSVNQQVLNAINLDDGHTSQANRFLNPTQLSAYESQTMRAYNPENSYHNQNPWQTSNPNLDQNPWQISNLDHDQNPSNEQNQISNLCHDQTDQHEEYDGRTHSLPCKKYGPYTCPKCKGVFDISQTFAAHMWSHYKYESNAERNKRLAARYKKKNLRLAYTAEGLTMVPDPSIKGPIKPVYRRKKSRPGKAKNTNVKVEDDQEQLRVMKDGFSKVGENSHSALAKVKEEPIEEKIHVCYELKIKKEPM
ncbi:hypothetical protein Pint_31292 [Pistacia integerrima]|uniref:Uncharacterized protein n=1 Tax=Pistacia integerrima TaxID=434235 RepID=A0ACC0XNZ3_9ROSI|nr:hypothetical protein Pint_31292 [Pistacia integerrima]